jgi:hypothetical protein
VSLRFPVSPLQGADEDDRFKYLLEDVALGFTIAACEADESCSKTMDAICLPILLVALITFCICPSKEEDDRNFEPLKPRRVVAKALQNGLSLSLFFVLCPLFFVILRKPEFRILGRS